MLYVASWLRPSCNKRQINKRKTTNLKYMHAYACKGAHIDMRLKKTARQVRLEDHPELRKGREGWGFKGEKGNSQKGDGKRKCMVNRVCLARQNSLSGENIVSGVALFLVQASFLRYISLTKG